MPVLFSFNFDARKGTLVIARSLRQLRKDFKRPNPQTGKTEFDEVAYSAELRRRLEDIQPVSSADLATLAGQRRDTIIAFLTARNEIPAERLLAGDSAEVELNDDNWVNLPLAVEPNPELAVAPQADAAQ